MKNSGRSNYLHRSTAPKLKHELIKELLHAPQAQLLEKQTAVESLLQNDKKDDLARTYREVLG